VCWGGGGIGAPIDSGANTLKLEPKKMAQKKKGAQEFISVIAGGAKSNGGVKTSSIAHVCIL